jgi:hypothetical protein
MREGGVISLVQQLHKHFTMYNKMNMQVVAMKVVETTATTTSSSQLVDMHDLCI